MIDKVDDMYITVLEGNLKVIRSFRHILLKSGKLHLQKKVFWMKRIQFLILFTFS